MTGILGKDKLGAFRLGVSNALELITDRTKDDEDRARYLNALWIGGTFVGTEEELAEWHSNLKGSYNAGDLNRVEEAVQLLSGLLVALPEDLKTYAALRGVAWDSFFDVPYTPDDYVVSVKTDWTVANIQSPEDMKRYLSNVALLRGALDFETSELPEQMEDLTWRSANAIEEALVNLNNAITALRRQTQNYIDATAAAWYYSGELYTGEV